MKLSLPKPTSWDLVAIAVAILGLGAAGANWVLATSGSPGGALSTRTATAFALSGLVVCASSLALLGKTVHNGTPLGNIAAAVGTLTGIGGSLLAAALWVAA